MSEDPRATALIAAITGGDVEAVRELVREDPGLASAKDGNGLPVILLALFHQQRAAAEALLEAGREAFARTLAELRDTAIELDDCRIWACAAAVEATGTDRALVEARLDGVLSTPRFLREVAGAELVVV